jgi:uncharacterized protein YcfL
MMTKILTCFILLLLVSCSSSPKIEQVDDGIDSAIRMRVEQWKTLIDSGSQWSDIKKLTSVNNLDSMSMIQAG